MPKEKMTIDEFGEAVTLAAEALKTCEEAGMEAFAVAFEEALGAYGDAVLERETAEAMRRMLDLGECPVRERFEEVLDDWRFDEEGNLLLDPARDDTLKTLYAAHLVYKALEASGAMEENDAFALKIWLDNDRDKVDLVAREGRYVILGATVGDRTIPLETVDWLNRHPDLCALEGMGELFHFARTLQSAAAQMPGPDLWRFILEFIQNVCARRAAHPDRRGRIVHVPLVRTEGDDIRLEPAPVVPKEGEDGNVVLEEVAVVKAQENRRIGVR